MSSLPLEVVEMVGHTITKVIPITIVLAYEFLGLQPGRAMVAQARTRHRHLLLDFRPGLCARVPHRAYGARRGIHLRNSWR
jgi:hypothetical protein